MIICRICAVANGLTEKPHPGVFVCENCGAAGQNDAFEVEALSSEQSEKGKSALEAFSERILEKVVSLARRGLREEKPS